MVRVYDRVKGLGFKAYLEVRVLGLCGGEYASISRVVQIGTNRSLNPLGLGYSVQDLGFRVRF